MKNVKKLNTKLITVFEPHSVNKIPIVRLA